MVHPKLSQQRSIPYPITTSICNMTAPSDVLGVTGNDFDCRNLQTACNVEFAMSNQSWLYRSF